jgi:hypothetical protein
VSPHAVIKSIGVMASIPAGGGAAWASAGFGAGAGSGSGSGGVGGTLNTVAAALGGGSGGGGKGKATSGGGGGGGSARFAEPVMLLLRGTDRVDLRAVAAHFGLARRHVRLATPEECVSGFG